jgi:hypothetical protein
MVATKTRLFFCLLTAAWTCACGALFGVDFEDKPVPPSDSGVMRGPTSDGALDGKVGGFCQTHVMHDLCVDFDEDAAVPAGWSVEMFSATVNLTTDASVSPPASLETQLWPGDAGDGGPTATLLFGAIDSASFRFTKEILYEVDARIVLPCSGNNNYGFVTTLTNYNAGTGWSFNPTNNVVGFFYLGPLAGDGGEMPTPQGYFDTVPVVEGVPVGSWVHLTADVTFSAQGATNFAVSVRSVNDAGPDAEPLGARSGPGLLFQPSSNETVDVSLGMGGYGPCGVELDNFTLDYQ